MGMRAWPRRGAALLAAPVLCLALLPGCQSVKDSLGLSGAGREHVISLHLFANAAILGDRLTTIVANAEGQPFTVRSIPLVSSTCFRAIDVIPGAAGGRTLRVHLDDHGRMLWMQACAEFRAQDAAVLVDGAYRGTMRIPNPGNDLRMLILPGPWEADEAARIAAVAASNYKAMKGR